MTFTNFFSPLLCTDLFLCLALFCLFITLFLWWPLTAAFPWNQCKSNCRRSVTFSHLHFFLLVSVLLFWCPFSFSFHIEQEHMTGKLSTASVVVHSSIDPEESLFAPFQYIFTDFLASKKDKTFNSYHCPPKKRKKKRADLSMIMLLCWSVKIYFLERRQSVRNRTVTLLFFWAIPCCPSFVFYISFSFYKRHFCTIFCLFFFCLFICHFSHFPCSLVVNFFLFFWRLISFFCCTFLGVWLRLYSCFKGSWSSIKKTHCQGRFYYCFLVLFWKERNCMFWQVYMIEVV